MTKEETIEGLKTIKDLILFDPNNGEILEPSKLSYDNKLAYLTIISALDYLEEQ